jgi:hypothetical protein
MSPQPITGRNTDTSATNNATVTSSGPVGGGISTSADGNSTYIYGGAYGRFDWVTQYSDFSLYGWHQ